MIRMFSSVAAIALVFAVMARPAGVRAQETQRDLPGPIDSLQDLQDTGKMLFKMADQNNDGQISQKEAVDAGNTMVGGFFFRADTNGDGSLSTDELRAARQEMMRQRPILNIFAQRARGQDGGQPASANANARQNVMSLLDSNNDSKIDASELRQLVNTTVQSGFAAADTNRDGQMSPSEVNAAIIGAARTAAQAAFQQADRDGNGQLSQEEFTQALARPAATAFRVVDSNGDGQLSPQEAQAAARAIATQLRAFSVPEPSNSARNMLRSGQRPAEATPVPSIPVPATGRGTTGFAPAPAPAPGTVPAPIPAPAPVPVQPQ